MKGKYFWLLIAPFMIYAKVADFINESRLEEPSIISQGFYLILIILFLGLFSDSLVSLVKQIAIRKEKLDASEN
ncbi:hypothetical protein QWZ13_03015 [Reinekea marina]|uniref:hypothetical protein n=1 Tax=Reinekea marina TaxID=1310421 RepID=UPI0025B28C53|nr:hypothetical protein [Reinekea marina]MDN3647881.1 hypothetical protein [Reinekea marina]